MTSDERRAQASLPALAIALLILASVTVLGLGIANGALAAADREPPERHVAASLADRLVAANGPVAVRQNVLSERAIARLDARTLRNRFPVVGDQSVRITVGGRRIVDEANAAGGTTVRRIVLVRRIERRTLTPPLGYSKAITLPRRTKRVAIELSPPNGTTIHTVRTDGRVVLRNDSGLVGNFDVTLSRFETVRVEFAGSGPLYRGNVTLRYPVERTHRATVAVTVDG